MRTIDHELNAMFYKSGPRKREIKFLPKMTPKTVVVTRKMSAKFE